MLNVEGPKEKRTLLVSVVHPVLLYGVPVWVSQSTGYLDLQSLFMFQHLKTVFLPLKANFFCLIIFIGLKKFQISRNSSVNVQIFH